MVPLSVELQQRVDRTPSPGREQAGSTLRQLQAQGITSFDQLARSFESLRDEALVTAIWSLPYFDKRRTIPLLLKLLNHSDPTLRSYALVALDMIGGSRAARAFARHLRDDPDPRVRESAAHGLGFLFDGRFDDLAFPPLLSALERNDECAKVRAQAAEGLGNTLDRSQRRTRRYQSAQAALIRALEDPAPDVRFWASFALGSMRSRAALPKLRQLAAEDDTFYPMWWNVNEEGRVGIGWTVGDEAGDMITCILTGEWPKRERRMEK